MPDPARWLNEHLQDWSDLPNKEKRAIRDFPVLWAVFELRATGRYGNRPDANPNRICEAVAELDQLPDQQQLIPPREHFSKRYFHDQEPTPAWVHLEVGNGFADAVKTGLIDHDADIRSIFLALLLVTNRLRNNYLHGAKAQYGFLGQYENFRHANNILMIANKLWDH